MEPEFPIEFLVRGTAVSAQAKSAAARDQWKTKVRDASRAVLPEGHFASADRIAATLYYFPDEPMQGDVDNIVKPVLDALGAHVYVDDAQVDRVVVQRFARSDLFRFTAASATLEQALVHVKPVLYVRLSDDPFEELP